jgi:alpha-tubulin suppressor-like RCC1 family protein
MRVAKRFSAVLVSVGLFVGFCSTQTFADMSGAPVNSFVSGVIAPVAAGYDFNCYLASGGVKCLGLNDVGELGNGTFTNSLTAVDVTGLTSGVVAITAGDNHACALLANGAVKCWGSNNRGQLGNGSTSNSNVPVQVTGLTSGVTSIDAAMDVTCAVTASGGAKCWGSNQSYESGSVTPDANSDGEADPILVPTDVTGLTSGVAAIAIGGIRNGPTNTQAHTCAVLVDGTVKCWGRNQDFELGFTTPDANADGYLDSTGTPGVVPAITNAVSVAAGQYSTCVLLSTGAVRCWGLNSVGDLGVGTTTSVALGTVVEPTGLSSGVTQIDASGRHFCAVMATGALNCWGANVNEVLKVNDGTFTLVPTLTYGLSTQVHGVVVGPVSTCAVFTDTSLHCWGRDNYGQQGDQYPGDYSTPQSIITSNGSALTGISSIAQGLWTGCALMQTGGVKCWGASTFNERGDGAVNEIPYAVDVPGFGGTVTSMDGGYQGVCAVLADGSAKCTGSNMGGRFGFGSTSSFPSAQPMMTAANTPVTSVTQVSFTYFVGCVLQSGAVKCAGSNIAGATGDGTVTGSHTYLNQVTGLTSGVTQISAGYQGGCALLTDSLRCWGRNQSRELGNGGVTNTGTPVTPTGLSTGVAQVAASDSFDCALMATGNIKCWGYNGYGQLGIGSTATQTGIVDVSGITNATYIGLGSKFGCALLQTGGVKCWGDNSRGTLGDGTFTSTYVPVDVQGLTSGVISLSVGITSACAVLSDHTAKCWGASTNGQLGNGRRATATYSAALQLAASGIGPLPTTTTSTTTIPSTTVPATTSTLGSTTTVPQVTDSSQIVSIRHDSKVYSKAPEVAGGVSAYSVLDLSQLKSVRLVTATPRVCVAGGRYVVTLIPGDCAVLLASLKDGHTLSVWRTKVVEASVGNGSTVLVAPSLRYGWMYDKGQPAQLASLYKVIKNATFALAVGHSALFTGNSPGNISVSIRRAKNVENYLKSRHVKAEVVSTGVGSTAPVTTILTEMEQARNRTVNVYYVP